MKLHKLLWDIGVPHICNLPLSNPFFASPGQHTQNTRRFFRCLPVHGFGFHADSTCIFQRTITHPGLGFSGKTVGQKTEGFGDNLRHCRYVYKYIYTHITYIFGSLQLHRCCKLEKVIHINTTLTRGATQSFWIW